MVRVAAASSCFNTTTFSVTLGTPRSCLAPPPYAKSSHARSIAASSSSALSSAIGMERSDVAAALAAGTSARSVRTSRRGMIHTDGTLAASQHAQNSWRDLGLELGDANAKNVLVLGGSYGGMHAASVLAQRLPPSHRVILIERNSHFNHLYVFPRFSTMPGKEHAAFIPYSSLFDAAPARPAKGSRSSEGSELGHPTSAHTVSTEHPHGPAGDGAALLGFERKHADQQATDTRQSASARADSTEWQASDQPVLQAQRTSTPSSESSSPESVASDFVSSGSSADTVATSVDKPQDDADDEVPHVQVRKLRTRRSSEGPVETQSAQGHVSEAFLSSRAHQVLQASVVSIADSHVVVQPAISSDGLELHSSPHDAEVRRGRPLWQIDQLSIPYTHLIYALGSHLPDPLRTPARTKAQGRAWLQAMQKRVEQAQDIVIVGGGALGVEYATDIASLYTGQKAKNVTLIHSRKQLLPSFDARIHDAALQRLEELGVNVVLGERLAASEGCPRGSTSNAQPSTAATGAADGPACEGAPPGEGPVASSSGMCLGSGRKLIRTTTGRTLEADLLLLCTGQQPSSQILAAYSPTSVDPTSRLIRVTPHLRVARPAHAAPGPVDPINPCGDCDCFVDGKAHAVDKHGKLAGDVEVDAIREAIHNVYAIGDCADAFGALNAGYQAWAMADVAAENILRSIEASSSTAQQQPEWQTFTPAPTMLKLSLGLGKMVFQGAPAADPETGEERPVIEVKEDPPDLAVEGVWAMAGHHTRDLYL